MVKCLKSFLALQIKSKKLYSREESKRIKESFWTNLGRYLSLTPVSQGSKVNWINYKTGIKYLKFKMNVNDKCGIIAIEICHPEEDIRMQMLDQFREYALLLERELGEKWDFDRDFIDEFDRPLIRIYKEISPVNILNKDDWPKLISFFKPRIISLHNFWSAAQYSFEKFKYL